MSICLSPVPARAIEVSVSTRAPKSVRFLFRETGLAVAVLAIYVLTLLLPLHQAAALQRDLDALGFAALDSWSVCQSLAEDDDNDPRDAAALTCPVTGIAKFELAAVLPPVLVIGTPDTVTSVSYASGAASIRSILPDHIGQSRAPPAAV